jgi:hypothetical protein
MSERIEMEVLNSLIEIVELRRAWKLALLVAALAFCTTASAAAQVPALSNESALVAFHRNLDAYVELRGRFEEPLPLFRPWRGTGEALLAQRYLASAIRTARHDDRPGNVFSPVVALAFRLCMTYTLTPAERLLLGGGEDGGEDAPLPIVNEPLPGEWMAAAPASLIQHLPELPQAIEYRFVGYDLILWDAHAGIVIDVLPDALR